MTPAYGRPVGLKAAAAAVTAMLGGSTSVATGIVPLSAEAPVVETTAAASGAVAAARPMDREQET